MVSKPISAELPSDFRVGLMDRLCLTDTINPRTSADSTCTVEVSVSRTLQGFKLTARSVLQFISTGPVEKIYEKVMKAPVLWNGHSILDTILRIACSQPCDGALR
jgi:hypothetical protein